ncbi:MAG: hypothetical protein C4290_09330 [Chloroflexota bacterium]
MNTRSVSTPSALWPGRLRLFRGRPGHLLALAGTGLLLEGALVSGLLLPLARWRQPLGPPCPAPCGSPPRSGSPLPPSPWRCWPHAPAGLGAGRRWPSC